MITKDREDIEEEKMLGDMETEKGKQWFKDMNESFKRMLETLSPDLNNWRESNAK